MVDVRSYSRISRQTSEERVIFRPGTAVAMMSARAFLVGGVDVGVQEADRQRLDLLRFQDGDQGEQDWLVERQQGGPVGGEAFGDFEAQVALHQRDGASM